MRRSQEKTSVPESAARQLGYSTPEETNRVEWKQKESSDRSLFCSRRSTKITSSAVHYFRRRRPAWYIQAAAASGFHPGRSRPFKGVGMSFP